jgi:hypothetical protein
MPMANSATLRTTTLEDILRPSRVAYRTTVNCLIAFGVAFAAVPQAAADDTDADPSVGGAPVQVAAGPMSDNADPIAAQACAQFADVLDGSATYYGDFADSFEGSSYSDPAVDSSNAVGRTALREAAATAMSTANTPGLSPEIADPMRTWSLGAAALLLKMGVRLPGESLNTTANTMNNDAAKVQQACVAAGTHA